LRLALLVLLCSTLSTACIFAADPSAVDSTDAAQEDTGAPVDADDPTDVGEPVDADKLDDAAETNDTDKADSDGQTRDADSTGDMGDTTDSGGCEDGKTRECGRETGACELGEQTCSDGEWGDCTGGTMPNDETCNGKDDDCDGSVDERVTRNCGTSEGICEQGTQTCDGGEWGDCEDATDPEENESCDGRDDDCDGSVDEGLERNCGQSEGICAQGTQTCDGGEWGSCQGNIGPSSEMCDGADNDCDGSTDEGVQTTYYRDSDGDGYGDPSTSTKACSSPFGYVSNNRDCYDDHEKANPRQMSWFATDRGDGSFDYDCDGRETKRWTNSYQCSGGSSASCSADPEGWLGPSDPGCGKGQSWIETCEYDTSARYCGPGPALQQTQQCR